MSATNCRVRAETQFCGDASLHYIKGTDITYEIAQFNTFISKLKVKMLRKKKKMSEKSDLE